MLGVVALVLHGGLDLRTDLGTHFARLAAGAELARVDVALALDPLWLLDGQHDLDVTLAYPAGAWSGFAGWRLTTIGVAGGTQLQEQPLAGVTGALPAPARWLRIRAGLELSVLLVKHGAGLPTEWIGGGRSLIDHLHLGLFVTVELAASL